MTKITGRALIARINRKLAREGQRLCILRGNRGESSLGRFYAVDVMFNHVTAQHVDPEKWGLELGVLRHTENVIW